jgi:hypothetical protein
MMKRGLSSPLLAGLLALVVMGFIAGAGSAPAAGSSGLASPHRLVLSNDLMQAFAQDGSTVAWINSVSDLYRVRARNLTTGKSVVLGDANNYRSSLNPPTLALASGRAFWTTCWHGNDFYIDGHTTTFAERSKRPLPKPVFLFELSQGHESGQDGYFAGAAGDGSTLVYGWTHFSPVAEPPVFDRLLDSGGVVRVVGPFKTQDPPAATPIVNVPSPAPSYSNEGKRRFARQLAVSQGRIAVVPPQASVSGQYWWGFPQPAENGPVVVSTRNGTVINRVFPVGTVTGIALAWPKLVVLVQRSDGSKAVELYDAATGSRSVTTVVPAGATDLAIGAGVVYRVGRSIYTIRSGHPTLLWRAQATPLGLSIEGRRIAWAVNLNGRGRIVALTLH